MVWCLNEICQDVLMKFCISKVYFWVKLGLKSVLGIIFKDKYLLHLQSRYNRSHHSVALISVEITLIAIF